MPSRLALTLMACAGALALAACKDNNPAKPAVYDFANASPAVVGLNPPAAYDSYALAERAHAFDRVAYRAAPSYGFRYGDEEPWAWRTADDYSLYAEPYDDGYRSYYYAPGGYYPYFIRDDDYGYGYGPNGVLVAVYDSYGELLPEDRLYALAALAGVYLLRASAIREYALDDRYRIAISEDYWSARAPRYYETQQVWYTAPERQPLWQEWRSGHERDVAQFLPRGDVRRWSKGDDRAWKAYEQTDRKAWQVEDRTWRNAERQTGRQAGQRVALAAPPAAYAAGDVREGRQDRAGGRGGGRRDEMRVQQEARVQAPRESGRHDAAGRGRDRVELATASPRPERETRRAQMLRPETPQAMPRDHGGGRQAQIARAEQPGVQGGPPREHGGGRQPQLARAEAPQPQAAPPRVHGGGGGGKQGQFRQEAAAAPAPPSAPPQQHQGGGGKPDRGAAAPAPTAAPAAAPQPGQGQGGGKGHGKDK
jgi:hypothetical protein